MTHAGVLRLIISGLIRSPLGAPRAWFAAVLAACLVTGAIASPSIPGASAEPVGKTSMPSSEYLLKAAFLYNFAKFTQWPESAFPGPAAPLRLCVLGDNPFGAALSALQGHVVNGRRLVTRQVSDPKALLGCHIVFIGGSAGQHPIKNLNRASDRPILSVGDAPGFARLGGVVSLKLVGEKVRFEINLLAAQRVGLKLDVRFLQMADIVYNKIAEGK